MSFGAGLLIGFLVAVFVCLFLFTNILHQNLVTYGAKEVLNEYIGFTELVAVALVFIVAPIIGVLLVEHEV